MPSFSVEKEPAVCPSCDYPEPDVVKEACELVEVECEGVLEEDLALRLSAYVGSYQAALLDGDQKAARSFLAHVAALSQVLLGRPV